MALILKHEERPSGRRLLTLAGTDDHMPQIMVPSGALGDPDLPRVLDIVADLKRTAYTVPRRSAKQKPAAQ